MNVLYFVAFWIAVAAAQIFPVSPQIRLARPKPALARFAVVLSVLGIVALSVAQQLTVESARRSLHQPIDASELPIHVLGAFAAGNGSWLVMGMLEAICLGTFTWSFANTTFQKVLAFCGAATLAALMLANQTIESQDIYAYVAHSLLGPSAYNPPAVPFSGAMRALNAWGVPVMRSTYGPLWNLGAAWLLGFVPSLGGKLLVLRLIGLASVVACAELAVRIGQRPVLRYLVLLNPYLYWVFVANAHNDLVAADLAICSALFLRRSPWAAVAAGVGAGLIKLPLVLLSCFPNEQYIRETPLRTRYLPLGLTIVLTLAVSWIVAGAPYFAALSWYARYANTILLRLGQSGEVLFLLRAATLLAALYVIARAWQGKPLLPALAWSLPCIGSGPFQQYQVWSQPAFARSGLLEPYFVALPIVMAGSTFSFFPATVAQDAATLAALVVAFNLYRLLQPLSGQRPLSCNDEELLAEQ